MLSIRAVTKKTHIGAETHIGELLAHVIYPRCYANCVALPAHKCMKENSKVYMIMFSLREREPHPPQRRLLHQLVHTTYCALFRFRSSYIRQSRNRHRGNSYTVVLLDDGNGNISFSQGHKFQ